VAVKFTVTIWLFVPLDGVTVIHGALSVIVQAQPWPVSSPNVVALAVFPTFRVVGVNTKEQAGRWLTLYTDPAMVRLPVRVVAPVYG
jgi:hypothetical protein